MNQKKCKKELPGGGVLLKGNIGRKISIFIVQLSTGIVCFDYVICVAIFVILLFLQAVLFSDATKSIQ